MKVKFTRISGSWHRMRARSYYLYARSISIQNNTFSPLLCLMDGITTSFPVKELHCRYEPVWMKICSRNCGIKGTDEYIFIWIRKTNEIWIPGQINPKSFGMIENMPHNFGFTALYNWQISLESFEKQTNIVLLSLFFLFFFFFFLFFFYLFIYFIFFFFHL